MIRWDIKTDIVKKQTAKENPYAPRLIAISGKFKGTVFALTEVETGIGRESTNPISLRDGSVSREHSRIVREGDTFSIHDLDSFNGTFVNGVPIAEQELKHGDQIGIGDNLMFFLTDETDSEDVFKDTEISFVDDDLNKESTIRLKREDAIYLRPENLLDVLPKMARTARDLSGLLKISSALASVENVERLAEELLELISEVIFAERGAILLTEKDSNEIAISYIWTADLKAIGSFQVSKTVLNACLSESESILSSDVSEDGKLGKAESLAKSHVRSVLCVPLRKVGKTLGVIYLDTSNAGKSFDKDHLQLLTGIAGVAAGRFESAKETEKIKLENEFLHKELSFERQIIGESPKMKEVFSLIARVAPTDSSVLIFGESGTGKELAARAIHVNSERKKSPFIAINCATLTENLLESELFGHEKGAFTGAVSMKRGHFELASGGTIFLDEIGEMDISLQARLLRVLQEREVMRIGGMKPIKIDVRILAATNKDLAQSVKDGGFRDDLFYRLNVINFVMPPLRTRREDIPLLTNFFLSKYNQKCKRNLKGISPEVRSMLAKANWDGNVRELENAIERGVILARGDTIMLEDLPLEIAVNKEFDPAIALEELSFHEAVIEAKKSIIRTAIENADGNVAKAARDLDMLPNNLHRLLKKLDLK